MKFNQNITEMAEVTEMTEMTFSQSELKQMDLETYEKQGCKLYLIAAELRAEYPEASSLLSYITTFLYGGSFFSSRLIKQKFISLSLSESTGQNASFDHEGVRERIFEIYALANELKTEHPAASILSDIATCFDGEGIPEEVIKQKLISLCLSEDYLQLNERFNRMTNSQKTLTQNINN